MMIFFNSFPKLTSFDIKISVFPLFYRSFHQIICITKSYYLAHYFSWAKFVIFRLLVDFFQLIQWITCYLPSLPLPKHFIQSICFLLCLMNDSFYFIKFLINFNVGFNHFTLFFQSNITHDLNEHFHHFWPRLCLLNLQLYWFIVEMFGVFSRLIHLSCCYYFYFS